MQIQLLSQIAKYGQSEALNLGIQNIKKVFPDQIFNLYYVILRELSKANHIEMVTYYMNDILQYMPMNEEQKDMLEIIKESF